MSLGRLRVAASTILALPFGGKSQVATAQILPGFSEQDDLPGSANSSHAAARRKSFSKYIGKALTESARRELSAIAKGKLRILPPGAMRTMDLIPDRMNISVDDDSIITAIDFG